MSRQVGFRICAMARRGAVAAAIGALVAAGAVAPVALAQSGKATQVMPAPTKDLVDRILGTWPETSTKAARAIVQKYGMPAEVTPTRMIWFNNGPWKRTMVINDTINHDFPMPHQDVLEQVINYAVVPDMMDELTAYDGSVFAEYTRGEMSARCDSEEANLIAINLAHDLIRGDKSVEEARQSYGEAIKAMMAGKPPEIAQRLTFTPPKQAGHSGKSIIQPAAIGQKKQ